MGHTNFGTCTVIRMRSPLSTHDHDGFSRGEVATLVGVETVVFTSDVLSISSVFDLFEFSASGVGGNSSINGPWLCVLWLLTWGP